VSAESFDGDILDVVIVLVDNPVRESNQKLATPVVDISLVKNYAGAFTATVCFWVVVPIDDESCLGFVNEKQEWECEDNCLQVADSDQEQKVCGMTSHFTNFAVLLTGIADGDGPGCSSFSFTYITGSQEGDMILVAMFVLGAIACGILICCISRIPLCGRLVYGKEYMRVEKLRFVQSQLNKSGKSATVPK
jgi:hypothetical protein